MMRCSARQSYERNSESGRARMPTAAHQTIFSSPRLALRRRVGDFSAFTLGHRVNFYFDADILYHRTGE